MQPIQNDHELKLFFKIICALVLPSSQLCECVRSPEPGVTDCCELPCGRWRLNLGFLEDLLVLLTRAISLAPNLNSFNFYLFVGRGIPECHVQRPEDNFQESAPSCCVAVSLRLPPLRKETAQSLN